jgi:hypothetical protein
MVAAVPTPGFPVLPGEGEAPFFIALMVESMVLSTARENALSGDEESSRGIAYLEEGDSIYSL